jgi:phospholipid/cholesterol/gamma-HCH transport system ATP-binding protein
MEIPLIEFENVTKRFDSRTILDRVNLKIYEGHITTIIGKSGTGKSVLLKHIIGLLSPDEGTIIFRGEPLPDLIKRKSDDYLGKISYMFQNNALFDSLTVYDNVALPLQQTTNLSKSEIDRKVMARIEQTELTEVAQKYPSELSGGMQKRVALSRALVTDPTVVLFDEPTTGQDPIRKNAILAMIAAYQKKFGFTAILISHDIPDVFFISNRILALYDGKIIFQGTPEELDGFEHPFQSEVIQSLEGLQEELTGLHSKRHFKVRYQTSLSRKAGDETYAVAVFTMEDLDSIGNNLGHETAQKLIKTLGAYIDEHFGAVGGFSTRHSIDEFVTVLPYSDLSEAERILADFTDSLQEQGLHDIQSIVQGKMPSAECLEFTISAGLAQGKPFVELESVIEFAKFGQKEIARFVCEIRR